MPFSHARSSCASQSATVRTMPFLHLLLHHPNGVIGYTCPAVACRRSGPKVEPSAVLLQLDFHGTIGVEGGVDDVRAGRVNHGAYAVLTLVVLAPVDGAAVLGCTCRRIPDLVACEVSLGLPSRSPPEGRSQYTCYRLRPVCRSSRCRRTSQCCPLRRGRVPHCTRSPCCVSSIVQYARTFPLRTRLE